MGNHLSYGQCNCLVDGLSDFDMYTIQTFVKKQIYYVSVNCKQRLMGVVSDTVKPKSTTLC